MRRLIGATVTAIAVIVVAHAWLTQDAYACSVGPDFDPVDASDIIVKGRFLGYEMLLDAPVPGLDERPEYDPTRDAYVPVLIDMEVESVFKGAVASDVIQIFDPVSLAPLHPGTETYEWIGSSGACGAFDDDPTGKHALLGLTKTENGLRSNRVLVFGIGEAPFGEWYDRARARLVSFEAAADLPALGHGSSDKLPALFWPALSGTLAAIGVVLLVSGAVARLRRRSIS